MKPLLMIFLIHMLRAWEPKPLYVREKNPVHKKGIPRKPNKDIEIGQQNALAKGLCPRTSMVVKYVERGCLSVTNSS
jgi:hypothetical protein